MSTETFTWPSKIASAIEDRGIDWSARIGAATVTGHSFTVEGDSTVEIEAQSPEGKITKVRIGGGVAGETVTILASVTTSAGTEPAVRVSLPIT